MNLALDFRSGLPIYLQVVERIKERIAGGQLKPGDQLPTVRSLALELRVNFNTIARSYRILDEMGIISTQQGRGTYIMNIPPVEVSAELRQNALLALTRRYLVDADRLGASPEELDQFLKDQMTAWQKTGHLPDPETDREKRRIP
jgi:GntR family transcriptional regulator